MDNIFGENTVSREMTQAQAGLPFNSNQSGIRPVSMASVAMCQMINNDIVTQVLNNKDVDITDAQKLIEFMWLHAADPELVSYCVVNYKEHPEILTQEALIWSMQYNAEDFLAYVKDIVKDKQNIANSKNEMIPEPGHKKRKNSQSQACTNG